MKCSRCGKVPTYPDYLSGRDALCTDCWWKKQRAARQRERELREIAPDHPTFYRRNRGSFYGYSSHTCTSWCPYEISKAIQEEGAL